MTLRIYEQCCRNGCVTGTIISLILSGISLLVADLSETIIIIIIIIVVVVVAAILVGIVADIAVPMVRALVVERCNNRDTGCRSYL